MPLAVLPALIPDLREVYDVYFAAFEGDIILEVLMPGGVDRDVHREHTIQWWHGATDQYTLKCVDQDSGEIVGMAIWEVFWRGEGWKKPPGIGWLSGKEKERAEALLTPMWETREKLFDGRKHVYLQSLAVHPAHRRRGIGKLLTQWGLDVAEQLGLPTYLESSESGFPLYQSLGFEQLSHVKIVLKPEITGKKEDSEAPLMVKMPSLAKGVNFAEWAEKGYPSFSP